MKKPWKHSRGYLDERAALCRYDAGEADAVSEEDADEFEFSDDEKEAAWKREQKALQPAKRKAQEAPQGRSGGRGGRHNGRHSNGSTDPRPGLLLSNKLCIV